MARTVETIYSIIISEKESLSSLDGLTPSNDNYQNLLNAIDAGSAVSEWRLWAYIQAVQIHLLEVLFDLFKEEIDEKAAAAIVGTLPWYQKIALEYEPGVSLVLLNSRWVYESPDESNRLIKAAAAVANGSTIFIKVAKGDGGDPEGLTALSGAELTAFSGYIQDRGFAGDIFNISSLNGDTLEVEISIYYDAFLGGPTVEAAVEAAIEVYTGALDFDGVVKAIKLIDAIQAVEGVRDVVVTSLTGKNGVNTTVFTREYETKAGYITYDSGNSTITMIADTNQ